MNIRSNIHWRTCFYIRQDYQEGAFVKKGQVLFEIDPRPFQAVLDQAKAQLAQAQAQMGNAELKVKRDIPEAEAHAIPQKIQEQGGDFRRRSGGPFRNPVSGRGTGSRLLDSTKAA